MSLFNSFFWLAYGLAIMDMVIFVPNACGFLLGAIQSILCGVFSSQLEISADNGGDQQLMENDDNVEGNLCVQNENVEII